MAAVPAPEARHNTAVILAGGVGTRLGLDLPKQLATVAGRPLIAHTLAVFDAHPAVDEILVLMAPGHLDAVRAIVRDAGFAKVTGLLEGGRTRSGTTQRALAAIPYAEGTVLLHDAVRPLVSERIVTECYRVLETEGAVLVAVPSTDTVVEVDDEGVVRSAPPRARLRRAQTPQGFRLAVIREAYARAAQDPAFEATDDCTVVLRYAPEVSVRVVPGEERNIKVTEPVDLLLAEQLLRRGASARSPVAGDGPGQGAGAVTDASA